MSTPSLDTILANNLQMTPVSIDINGVATPIAANWEYTDGSVSSAYAANFQAFVNIFNIPTTTSSTGAPVVDPARMTPALVAAAQQALFGGGTSGGPLGGLGLIALAQNPIEIPPGSKKFFGLTVQMATNLDQLLRSLASVGWDGTQTGLNAAVLNKWKDASLLSSTASDVITGAISAIQNNRTLQASVESVYVHEANDLIASQLSNMEQALSNSQATLDTLSSLQNIKNQIIVSSKTSINFVYNVKNFDGDDGDFSKAYYQAASAHFGSPIIPHIPSSLVVYGNPPTTNLQLQAIMTQETTLQQQIQGNLDAMNTIINSLNAPLQTPEVQNALSNYNVAVATYVSFIQQNPNATATQVINAQKEYLTAANKFNEIFWNGRLFNVFPLDHQGNPITGGDGDFLPNATNPPVPGKTNQTYPLTWSVITDPFSVPPTLQQVFQGDDVNDPDHLVKTYANLADYAKAAQKAWNDDIQDNFEAVFTQLNSKINALNSSITAYNTAFPSQLQVSTIGKLPTSGQMSTYSWNAPNGMGTTQPVTDGSDWVKINPPYGGTVPDKQWGDYENSFGFDTQQGAGIVYPGNPYAGNPFSTIPTRLNQGTSTQATGDFGVANNIFNNALGGNLNQAAISALTPFALTTGSGNAPIKNPIINGGLVVDKEGRPVLTPVSFTAQGRNYFSQLLVNRDKIISQITFLQTITPTIPTPSGGRTTDPNTLLGKLRNILNDMNKTLTANGAPITAASSAGAKLAAFNRWILDNYDKAVSAQASQAGLLQQNITFGIVAAQSFNDSQKTKVQSFMFVFEEYYKSAAAILAKITEIIEKVAQGISR